MMGWFLSTHAAGVLGFLLLANLVALANALWLANLDQVWPSGVKPAVAILIPARNEEANLPACLESLLAQTYGNFAVWVLDDHSGDRTAAIAAEFAVRDPRVHHLSGSDLPPGWLGKHWACQQLAEASQGEILLFVDADTRFHPQMLADTVGMMEAQRLDLLSAFPRQEMGTIGERLLVPYFQFVALAYIPLFLARPLRIPAFAFAIGQFLGFRRTAYEALGGHAAIRQEAVDDIAFARRAVSHRLRWGLADATRRVSCRMYHGFSEARRGFSKNVFAAFDYRLLPYLFIWFWCLLAYLEPLGVLLWATFGNPVVYFSLPLALSCQALVISLWLIPCLRLGIPVSPALLYPLTYLVNMEVGLRAVVLALRGGAEWKGRRIKPSRMRLF